MNGVIETIKNRRSVRAYEKKEIPQEIIEKIVEAGDAGPSGANVRPWRFVVVKSREMIKKLQNTAIPFYKNWIEGVDGKLKEMRKEIDSKVEDPVYYDAPLIIFVVGTKVMAYESDCAMACQNMMLAARSMDIGSCWVQFGQFGLSEEIKSEFEISENEKVFGPILFGYPKDGVFPEAKEKESTKIKWM